MHPVLDALPTRKAQTRVVYADLGLDARGRINWGSPFMQGKGIKGIPYIYLLDQSGNVGAEGEAARAQLGKLLSTQ